MAGPELTYLAAGGVVVAGSVVTRRKAPPLLDVVRVGIGTVILVLVASATTGTRAEPVARAFGLFLLTVATLATTRHYLQTRNTNRGR